jgi:SAM-dependent methyltransferase
MSNQIKNEFTEQPTEMSLREELSQSQARLDGAIDLLKSIRSAALYRLLRKMGRWGWMDKKIQSVIENLPVFGDPAAKPVSQKANSATSLQEFVNSIDEYNSSQPNADLLHAIRQYNHEMLDQFHQTYSLYGKTMLDIGASPHGYALEQALQRGVSFYTGITLSLEEPVYIHGDSNQNGILLKMDATDLRFPDRYFDTIFSISTFEHILDIEKALAEIKRVLKTGGYAFLSFEPIWSSPAGHHLHHFGECSKVVPSWAHLVWAAEEMRSELSEKWPADAPVSLAEAVNWVYLDEGLNRKSLRDFKKAFENCGLVIEWLVESRAESINHQYAERASRKTGLGSQELEIQGLSILFKKQ